MPNEYVALQFSKAFVMGDIEMFLSYYLKHENIAKIEFWAKPDCEEDMETEKEHTAEKDRDHFA